MTAEEELKNRDEALMAKRKYVEKCNHLPELVIDSESGPICCECWAISEQARAQTLELETQSLTRRLEEATKERDDAKFSRDHWRTSYEDEHRANRLLIHTTTESDAKLTALRTAASAARDAIKRAPHSTDCGWHQATRDENHKVIRHQCTCWKLPALAALRAELDQAASNASNSPTASRDK